MEIMFTLNREERRLSIAPEEMLVDVIRNRFGLKGTKRGCGGGQCGACTVLMNGSTVYSCILPAIEADGAAIETIEGIGEPGCPHPLQTAFAEEGAVQCGFCTPGMILSAKALLDKNDNPSEDDIRRAISGNLCRCTGYGKIIDAIAKAAETMRRGERLR